MKLVSFDDPILTKPAMPVRRITREVKEIVSDMFRVMYENNGIGLAAPQVGIGLQIITIDVGKNDPFVLINPKIIHLSKKTQSNIEGCLSFPNQLFSVERSLKITVKAKAISGIESTFTAEGLESICIQHECDHLRGVTFDKIGTIFIGQG